MCVDIPVFPTRRPFPGYQSAIGYRGGRGFGDVEGGVLFCELTLVRSGPGELLFFWGLRLGLTCRGLVRESFSSSPDFHWA